MTAADLRARRQDLGLSQEQLARALDVPAATVNRWENGRVTIRHARVLSLALEALERRTPDARAVRRRGHLPTASGA